ncbi:MAG: hypothetical protein ACRDTT_25765, partial [Pseudonocardiaceae bacterium]
RPGGRKRGWRSSSPWFSHRFPEGPLESVAVRALARRQGGMPGGLPVFGTASLPLVQTGLGSFDGAVLRRPPLPLYAFGAVLEGEVGPDPNHDPHRPVGALIEASGSRSHQVGIPPRSRAVRAHLRHRA